MKDAELVEAVEVTELVPLIQDYEKYDLEEGMAKQLASGLPVIVKQREALFAKADEILAMDINDPKSAKLASEARKAIKENRTKGIERWRKTTGEVYLRAKQFIDAIGNKESLVNTTYEEQLEKIEKHAEIEAAKKLKQLEEERAALVAPYVDGVTVPNLGILADDFFETYLSGLKAKYQEKVELEIKAKKEAEEATRRLELVKVMESVKSKLHDYWPEGDHNFMEMSNEDFEKLVVIAEENKAKAIEAQEKLRAENERLRKEREEQEAIEAEKLRVRNERAELLRPYIAFIDNYNGLIEKSKDEFNEVFESVKLVAQKQWAKEKAEQEKKQQEEEARLKKEREERKALEDALEKERAEREAERKAKEKAVADEAKRLAELAKSGDVAILNDWFTKNFSDVNKPNGELSPIGESIYQNIVAKFQGFQAWGTKMINE